MFGFISKEIIREGTREGIVLADHDLWGDKFHSEKIDVTRKVKTSEMRKVPTGTVKATEYTGETLPAFSPTETATQRKVVTKKFWYDVMYRTKRNRQTGEYTTEEISRIPLYEEVLSEKWELI